MKSKTKIVQLAILAFIATLTSASNYAYKVNLPLPNSKIASITLCADFGLDQILIHNAFKCTSENGCILLNTAEKSDIYHGVSYTYQEATLDIHVPVEDFPNETASVPIRLVDVNLNVVGINKHSPLNNLLKRDMKWGLQLNLVSGDMSIAKVSDDYIYDLDKHTNISTKQESYYIKSVLRFENNNKVSKTRANLCFENTAKRDNTRPYFFEGSESFVKDWSQIHNDILTQLIFGKYAFSVEPEKLFPGFFSVPYDMNLFSAYDTKPMKAYDSNTEGFCDLFVGRYFVERSSLVVYLKGGLKGSLAYIYTKTGPYPNRSYTLHDIAVRLIIVASIAGIAYFLYQYNSHKKPRVFFEEAQYARV